MATIQELQIAMKTAEEVLTVASQTFNDASTARDMAAQTFNTATQAYNDVVAIGIQSGTVGTISSVTLLEVAERNSGIQGASEYVKLNPTCAQEDAIAAWTSAATTSTGLPALIQDPNLLFILYTTNLQSAGIIPDKTWESLRSWIITTPIQEILAD